MRRLRWQLTLSHLVAIAFTLMCMVAAVVFLASAWWVEQTGGSHRAVALAHSVAQSIGGMVEQGSSSEQLGGVLRAMQSGQLRLNADFGPPNRGPIGDLALSDANYIVVLNRQGQVLASSTAEGRAFAPSERSEWTALATPAQAGGDPRAVPVPDAPGAPALGAALLLDARGQPIGSVIVAVPNVPAAADPRPWFWPVALFGVATLAVLGGASVFALIASTIIGYFLSRRLVSRLEQLGAAAERLRGGDLTARVPLAGSDEVSQLQRAFNSMASDLERTVADLATERDRVSGLLEARRQLVAGVSHELRTPIATVRGYLEATLRRDGELPADVRSDLATADREVTRLEGMIDDLFTLARAEVGKLELRVAPTDLGAVVRGQVETQAPLAWRQRQVQVLADVPAEGPVAEVDAQRVAQIVSNLLSNAVRHTPPGGLVAASARDGTGGGSIIEVRDTGEGIAAEALPHVFERFYQADGDSGRGAGLGLALVKELAESMGGRVEVSSTVGEGSCFAVTFGALK